MQTDEIPGVKAEKDEYWRSDALHELALPPPQPLRALAVQLKGALKDDDKKLVQAICKAMLAELSDFYDVPCPGLSILAKRPLKTTKDFVQELFGDYTPETQKIRLWMRTAVQQKPTSHGVLLSTFCHEFLHHLDMVALDLPETYHTRGFFARVGLLYHHIQDTPRRPIVWRRISDGTYMVDWGRTMQGRLR